MSVWRLLLNGKRDPCFNMAADEAMFEFYRSDRIPILRLYGWSPCALSIGRNQIAQETVDLPFCGKEGIAVVRRMTGGSTIFHCDEITYSLLCTDADLPGVGSVKESYRKLCSFLLLFYRKLGLDAAYSFNKKRETALPAFCFAGMEEYDVVLGMKKIGGNAQRRKEGMILQHGSLPFSLDMKKIVKLIRDVPADIGERTTSLCECLTEKIDFDCAEQLLASSFETALEATLDPRPLTSGETEIISRLVNKKYATDGWNLFR